jgi:hypothetical protein
MAIALGFGLRMLMQEHLAWANPSGCPRRLIQESLRIVGRKVSDGIRRDPPVQPRAFRDSVRNAGRRDYRGLKSRADMGAPSGRAMS